MKESSNFLKGVMLKTTKLKAHGLINVVKIKRRQHGKYEPTLKNG